MKPIRCSLLLTALVVCFSPCTPAAQEKKDSPADAPSQTALEQTAKSWVATLILGESPEPPTPAGFPFYLYEEVQADADALTKKLREVNAWPSIQRVRQLHKDGHVEITRVQSLTEPERIHMVLDRSFNGLNPAGLHLVHVRIGSPDDERSAVIDCVVIIDSNTLKVCGLGND